MTFSWKEEGDREKEGGRGTAAGEKTGVLYDHSVAVVISEGSLPGCGRLHVAWIRAPRAGGLPLTCQERLTRPRAG